MKADYLPPDAAQDPNTQDPHRMVQCTAQPDVLWVQHHCGLYRSTDAGVHWQQIASPPPSGFGFAVAGPFVRSSYRSEALLESDYAQARMNANLVESISHAD